MNTASEVTVRFVPAVTELNVTRDGKEVEGMKFDA
jgi:hypothetical protein